MPVKSLFRSIGQLPGLTLLPPSSPFYLTAVNGGKSAYTGPVVWLDSLLGLSGSDQSQITSWPDQSGNGFNANNTGAAVNPKLQVSTGVQTPNGKQTVRFFGQDFPNQCILGNGGPNPYPAITNGYSFYVMEYNLSPVSSSGLSLIWDESGGGAMRWGPGFNGAVVDYGGQTEEGSTTNFKTTLATVLNAWETNRIIFKSGGTIDWFRNGTKLSWQAANNWTFTPGVRNGYTLCNLLANEVTGFNGYLVEVIWFDVEHNSAQQISLDNWMRQRFGLPLVNS